ncbi:MAG: PBSX family phage terminase large subunit [Corynebacterium sp.]|nr:PBSX family phage terminase large subunit [Corynebacterium sp.]
MPALSPAQSASIRDSTASVNGWEGAIRSGKTIASLIRWAQYARTAPHGHLAILGWTLTTIQRNVLDPMVNLHPGIVRHTRGSNVAWIMGREVQLIGFSDKRSEAVIRGLTLSGAYVDEATLMPEGTWMQLLGRLSVEDAKLFFTTNPDAKTHWMHKNYLARLRKLTDWRIFHFTMHDNPGLAPEYIAAKTREFTGLWYRRFILGEWVSAEGAIFDMYDEDEHAVHPDDVPPLVRMFSVGMDYGTTNATSGVALGLGTDGILYAVDEWRYDSTENQIRLTDGQLSARARDFVQGLPMQPEWIAIDPAAASFRVQLQMDGVRNTMNAENDVLYGIRTVASLMATGRLKISKACTGLLDEVPSYTWDPKATAAGEDKPLKVGDHSIDALRYAVATTETLWRPYIEIPTP